MKKCPKCNQAKLIKDGFMKGNQRYKCKSCYYRSILSQGTYRSSFSIKRKALQLYLEGLGFRSIGRILNYSHVSVYNWIKSFGKNLKNLKSEAKIKNVEIDEMHTYISNKKTIAGFGLLLIDLEKNISTSLLAKEI